MKTLAIIGAGASGVFCAASLGKVRGLKTVVLEASRNPLAKVLLSGGGRCNFTNTNIDSGNLKDFYPRGASALRKPFRRFGARATAEFFESIGIGSKCEEGGRMFPLSEKSEDLAEALFNTAVGNRAEFKFDAKIVYIKRVGEGFEIFFKDGTIVRADYVLVACGGDWHEGLKKSLEDFGHSFEDAVPSLFSLKLDCARDKAWRDMSGLPVEAELSAEIGGIKISSRADMLITHFGAGGPAVLKFSSFGAREFAGCGYKFDVSINFLPQYSPHSIGEAFDRLRCASAKKMVKNSSLSGLPASLWGYILQRSGVDGEKTFANFSSADQKSLRANLENFKTRAIGRSVHKDEFVSCGGLRLGEVDFSSMQSKLVPNLFFAGECLDIDGITGGFNLQAAWTTSYICADFIRNSLKNRYMLS